MSSKEYLGDGLYAEDDGYQFRLSCDRGMEGIHEVFLDGQVFSSLLAFAERARGVKIKVESAVVNTECRGCGLSEWDSNGSCLNCGVAR